MSNDIVGSVYDQIIDGVITSSRVDFEEAGVDEAVLEELRLGWQRKLSHLGVAVFPWDPKEEVDAPAPPDNGPDPALLSPDHSLAHAFPSQPPDPGPLSLPQHSPTTAHPPSNGYQDHHQQNPNHQQISDPQQQQQQQQQFQHQNGGTDFQNGGRPEELPSAYPQNVAAMRATQQLQNAYGNRAADSINAIRTGISNPSQDQQQQQPQQQQQQAPLLPHLPQHAPHLGRQTDGTVMDPEDDDREDSDCLAHATPDQVANLDRQQIDKLLHQRLTARVTEFEGGGLMVPLDQAIRQCSDSHLDFSLQPTQTQTAQTQTTRMLTTSASASAPMPPAAHQQRHRVAGQYDGVADDDDDEDDEDAINSDLDDPEDDDGDSDNDDDVGHMMLCMYDKVNRTKNKWKCILKDGILTVNGKDYIFHKATGEFEW